MLRTSFLFFVFLSCLFSAVVSGREQEQVQAHEELLPLYLNVAGDKYGGVFFDDNESTGITTQWIPDVYFIGGSEKLIQIGNDETVVNSHVSQKLFLWQREGKFRYEIPLMKGEYRIHLHFAEFNEMVKVGDRVMDVKMENKFVLTQLDILQETAGAFKSAIVKTVQVQVNDGILNINFSPSSKQAKFHPILSGMEVHPLFEPPAVTPRLPARYDGLYETKVLAVAAMMRYDGKVIFWSSSIPFGHPPPKIHQTYISVFDPDTGASTREIVRTEHDMFCPGVSTLEDGRVMITGGRGFNNTSYYDPFNDYWTKGPRMHVERGYQSQATLGDGTVFVMGGSWPNGNDPKYAEVWTDDDRWTEKPNLRPEGDLITGDQSLDNRDNFMWFIQAPDGRLLHAGPSRNMHWIDVKGDGAVTHIGPRGDDEDSMCGNAVVYDIGKVLKLGGSPRLNHRNPANNQAYVIDVNGADDPVVTRVDDMHYARGNVNSVVLPNGEVLVVGGQTKAKGISDMYSALVCEIWSPETQKFTLLDGMLRIPRNYHSTALLLRDGRVITAGQNYHFNAEIITPPYLLDDNGNLLPRPIIESYSSTALPYRNQTAIQLGGHIAVEMDTSQAHTFALVRLGAVTHSTNIDQRRVPLQITSQNGTEFVLDVPNNTNIVLPGSYFLFAMNENGVPSVGVYFLREPRIPDKRNIVYPTPPPKKTQDISIGGKENSLVVLGNHNSKALTVTWMVSLALLLTLVIAKYLRPPRLLNKILRQEDEDYVHDEV